MEIEINPGDVITARVAGHTLTLLVQSVHEEEITGFELIKYRNDTFKKAVQSGGHLVTCGKTPMFVRHCRTIRSTAVIKRLKDRITKED